MALTVTRTGDWFSTAGNRHKAVVTIDFDSSYARLGEAFAPADVGMRIFERVDIQPKNGYYFEMDYTGNLIIARHGRSSGIVNINTTAVGNVGAGTDDLMTYSIPANTLNTNLMGVRVVAWGTAANNANAKTVTGNFGAGTIVSTALTASQVGTWRIVMEVIRTGAAAHEAIGQLNQGGTTTIVDVEQSAPTDDTTAAIVVKCTGAATADNDIVQEGMIVELITPPGTGNVGTEVPNAADLSGLTGVRVEAYGY